MKEKAVGLLKILKKLIIWYQTIAILTFTVWKPLQNNGWILALFQLKPHCFLYISSSCRSDNYSNDWHLLFTIFTWCLQSTISISTISSVQLGVCYRLTLIPRMRRSGDGAPSNVTSAHQLCPFMPPHSCIFSCYFCFSAVNVMEKIH